MWGYSDEELGPSASSLRTGGAVILMGSGRAPDAARQNLNEVAAAVGTDLRVNNDRIRDGAHAVRGIDDLVYTGEIEAAPDIVGRARAGRGRGRDQVGAANDGIDDPDDFEISGFREVSVPTVQEPISGSKYNVVPEGERVRIDITIEEVNHPAKIRQPLRVSDVHRLADTGGVARRRSR